MLVNFFCFLSLQKKLVSLMEEIHELQKKADNKVEDKMKTLEEEIEYLKTGESVLNTQTRKIVDLIKSFEELELKLKEVKVETQET